MVLSTQCLSLPFSFTDGAFNPTSLSLSLSRPSYDGLEKKLKEVFSERSSILHQLSKTSKELDSIKGNLQVCVLCFLLAEPPLILSLPLKH